MTVQISGTAGVTFPDGLTQPFGAGNLINVRVFTIANTGQTYTPTTGTKSIIVEAVGGGGGGGGAGATAAAQVSYGAGGGSGAYAVSRYTTGFSGVTLTIGAAGTGVAGSTPGTTGGTTTFGALLSCPGGVGGDGSGATGNTATTYLSVGYSSALPTGFNILGAKGSVGGNGFALSGIGGSGAGGSTKFGGGGAATVNTNGSNNADSTGYGAGGGGAANTASQAVRAGGNGTSGAIIIYEYA